MTLPTTIDPAETPGLALTVDRLAARGKKGNRKAYKPQDGETGRGWKFTSTT